MKRLVYFLFLVFCSCVSSNKDYDSVQSSSERKNPRRNISYLKDLSKIEDNNYNFIFKQMQKLIRNYKSMKKQLSKIEEKLEESLKKWEVYQSKKNDLNTSSVLLEDQIIIKNKDEEEIVLTVNKLEDYKYIMGGIVAGDYGVSESEAERALNVLKEKLKTAQAEIKSEADKTEEQSEIDTKKEEKKNKDEKPDMRFNEDSLIMDQVTDEKDIFSLKDVEKIEGKDDSAFLLGKQLFDSQSYEDAISEFQRYRNDNPEGKHYMEATFYIGQSFEKLKMPIEADIFFQEIIKSDSQSLWALRVKKQLDK